MRHLKLFEDFKKNNQEGTLLKIEDIIECIKRKGVVYATIVKELPNNDPKKPLRPVDVDEDGLVTVEWEGNEYQVDLNDIEKIEY